MRKFLCILASFFVLHHACAQSADEKAVRKILSDLTIAWNAGSIDEFMKGYWNNDSLMFIGKSGVTYGYQNTLMNYKKHYSNADEMGNLAFDLIKVKQLSPDYFFIVGKYYLKRKIGDLSGHYDLLFHKINGKWLIVADHSS